MPRVKTKYKKWMWLGPANQVTPCNNIEGCKDELHLLCPGHIRGDCPFEGNSMEEDHVGLSHKDLEEYLVWVMVETND
jgi:hypothetical protein